MNFAEAWALCLAGKRIRRASWDRDFFWFLMNGNLFERTDMHGPERVIEASVSNEELLATDWEEA